MKSFILKSMFTLCALLSQNASANENPCLGLNAAHTVETMAQLAGEGLYAANSFGLAQSPSLWDSKTVKTKTGKLVITQEFKNGVEENATSFFYKSTINPKSCKVLKAEVVNKL